MTWQIVKADLLTEQQGAERDTLVLQFEQDWHLEDAQDITEQLMAALNGRIVEQIEGADRISFRVLIDNQPMILQFEFYSHACWFEAELDEGFDLAILAAALNG